jgi:hypothetical protein
VKRRSAIVDSGYARHIGNRWLLQTTCNAGSSGDFPPPSPPAEKATASQDQARQSRTSDGTGDRVRLSINEVIHNGYTRAELAKRQSYIATCYLDTAHFG